MKKTVKIVLMVAVAMAAVLTSGCAVKAKIVKTDIVSQPIRSASVHIVSPEVFEDSQTMGFWLSMPVAFLTGPVGAVAVPAGMSADMKSAESKFFIKPTDKEFSDRISLFYTEKLKAEMEKNGFTVAEETNDSPDSPLVIKTKIGIITSLSSFGIKRLKRGRGLVAMEVEIYRKDVLIGRLQTNNVEFASAYESSNIESTLKDLLKEVAKELKNNFL